MRALRVDDRGADVKRWQLFLRGQGFDPGLVDGIFGKGTREASISFQLRHGLVPDGVVSNRTVGVAMQLGFTVVTDPSEEKTSPNFPPPPDFDPIIGLAGRQKAFGKFDFVPQPIPGNPENIRVVGDWPDQNLGIAQLPISKLRGAPSSGKVQFYKRAIPQLEAMWTEWADNKLLGCLVTWDGSYVPRFVRGSKTALSNHAFGTAFDINAERNPLGAQPALVGKEGCVRELVGIANKHGFYWGGHFKGRPDGMHFEVAILKG